MEAAKKKISLRVIWISQQKHDDKIHSNHSSLQQRVSVFTTLNNILFRQPQHVLFFRKKKSYVKILFLFFFSRVCAPVEVDASLTSHQYLSCIMAQHYFLPSFLSLATATKKSEHRSKVFLSPLTSSHNGKRFISRSSPCIWKTCWWSWQRYAICNKKQWKVLFINILTASAAYMVVGDWCW